MEDFDYRSILFDNWDMVHCAKYICDIFTTLAANKPFIEYTSYLQFHLEQLNMNLR